MPKKPPARRRPKPSPARKPRPAPSGAMVDPEPEMVDPEPEPEALQPPSNDKADAAEPEPILDSYRLPMPAEVLAQFPQASNADRCRALIQGALQHFGCTLSATLESMEAVGMSGRRVQLAFDWDCSEIPRR